MADKLVSSLAARDKLRTEHERLSAEFDKQENDETGVRRKYEINGAMEALRFALREIEALPDATPPAKKEDD